MFFSSYLDHLRSALVGWDGGSVGTVIRNKRGAWLEVVVGDNRVVLEDVGAATVIAYTVDKVNVFHKKTAEGKDVSAEDMFLMLRAQVPQMVASQAG